MILDIKDLNKDYQNLSVLKDLSFKAAEGDIISIIGPSGSGKTTLLKIIAQIEQPTSGTISYSLFPSREHSIILVFQDYLLFPLLTVFNNVAFGLKARKLEKNKIRKRVNRYLEIFGLGDKAKLYPHQLSAGQQQRAAIARAMVIKPSLLLLDEPFANLDKNLKVETAEFIRNTQKELGTTTISVTHDLEEAFAMSDKIGILIAGNLVQFDKVEKVYYQPASYQAASFLGPVNRIPNQLFPTLNLSSSKQFLYTRAEAIELEKDPQGPAVIKKICFIGVVIMVDVELEATRFKVYTLNSELKAGDRVRLTVLHYF